MHLKGKSQINIPTKASNGSKSRGQRYREDNINRGEVRASDTADTSSRGSAKVMGLKWIGSYCDESHTIPHYLVEVDRVAGQSLMLCKKCLRAKILPMYAEDYNFMHVVKAKVGIEEAYQMYLDKHTEAKKVASIIQHQWESSKEVLCMLLPEEYRNSCAA